MCSIFTGGAVEISEREDFVIILQKKTHLGERDAVRVPSGEVVT